MSICQTKENKQTLWKICTYARSSIHWDSWFSLVTASFGFNIIFSLTSPASCPLYDSKSFLFFAERMLCVCVCAHGARACACVCLHMCVRGRKRGRIRKSALCVVQTPQSSINTLFSFNSLPFCLLHNMKMCFISQSGAYALFLFIYLSLSASFSMSANDFSNIWRLSPK